MNQHCSNCRFYRIFRPASQLLMRDLVPKRDLGREDEKLQGFFHEVSKREEDIKDSEAEHLRILVSQREKEWDYTPTMSHYCGKQEDEGKFLVWQVKNENLQCRDHDAGARESRPCATCRHRATGGGKERDQQELVTLRQLIANAVSLGQGDGNQMVEEYLKKIASSKSFEANEAYYTRTLASQPRYLPFCLKYSRNSAFVACAIQNPHDACSGWTAPDAPPEMSLQDAMVLLGWSKRNPNDATDS